LTQVDEAIAAGVDAGRLTEQMLGYFRDLMAVSVGCDASLMRYAAASMHPALHELGHQWGLQTVLAIVGLVDETLVRIRHSVHARVLLESTLIQICHLPDLQSIVDLATAAAAAGGGANGAAKANRSAASPNAAAEKKNAVNSQSPPTASVTPVAPAPSPQQDTAPRVAAPSNATPSGAATVATPAAAPQKPPPSVPMPQAEPESNEPESNQPKETSASDAYTDPITDSILQSAWEQILGEIDPITATLVRATERIDAPEPGVVRLTFPESSSLAMNRCGAPNNREEITQTISRVTGKRVSLAFATGTKSPVAEQVAAKPKAKNRMQRMQEIEAKPIVRACIELLGAEIVKIDTPR
jgi:DNA polymerase-3 subunit gamma/tau